MRPFAFLLLAIASFGCATSTKASLLEKTLRNDKERHELFEANLEVLDRHPGWVDEFFRLTLQHRATLDRIVEDQTAELESNPMLARLTAEHLRRDPKALQITMTSVLDAVEHDAAARRAIANAVRARATLTTDILVHESDALGAVGKAMAKKAKDDPSSREHMKTAFKDVVTGSDDKGDDKKSDGEKKK